MGEAEAEEVVVWVADLEAWEAEDLGVGSGVVEEEEATEVEDSEVEDSEVVAEGGCSCKRPFFPGTWRIPFCRSECSGCVLVKFN